jgi:NAD(P)-dependent dehydrogenase (short-subunit alcohol dehydrogenase family)
MQINNNGGTAEAYRVDISKEKAVEALFEKIASDPRFGRIDILVNNSGIFSSSLQTELSAAEWQRLFDVNVKGLFLCSREAARQMQTTGGGVIVNLASINALHPGFGMTAHYDATKGAVAAYTRSLAAELGPLGIRVNAVAPGLVDSAGLRASSPELADMVEERNPLRNRAGKSSLVHAEEVADAAVFLASHMARSITGEILVVDRGYLLT